MKVLVVSGFLGAGKTTFIKELIRKSGTLPVILENEYGENDIDKRELEKVGELEILEFMEGCVCCTKKDSFLNSILAISAALDPEYLIVEPTGVGKLGNVLENIQTVTYDRIRLLPPVVVLCPQTYLQNLADYPEIYRNQVENAGVIVFSKCENTDPAVLAQIEAQIRQIDPSVPVISEHYSGKDAAWFRALLDAESEAAKAVTAISDEEPPDEISLRGVRFDAPGALVRFLENILRGSFGDVVRAKGIAEVGEELLRFDVADGQYAIIREEDEAAALQCVLIGRDLRAAKVRSFLGLKKAENDWINMQIGRGQT